MTQEKIYMAREIWKQTIVEIQTKVLVRGAIQPTQTYDGNIVTFRTAYINACWMSLTRFRKFFLPPEYFCLSRKTLKTEKIIQKTKISKNIFLIHCKNRDLLSRLLAPRINQRYSRSCRTGCRHVLPCHPLNPNASNIWMKSCVAPACQPSIACLRKESILLDSPIESRAFIQLSILYFFEFQSKKGSY